MTRVRAWLARLWADATGRDHLHLGPEQPWPWPLNPYTDHPDTEGSNR